MGTARQCPAFTTKDIYVHNGNLRKPSCNFMSFVAYEFRKLSDRHE